MDLVRTIPSDYTLDITGHSYGGASIIHSLKKHPKLRDRVNEVHLYNPLTSSWSSKVHTKRGEKSDSAEKIMDDKTTVHRVKGDIVSMAGTYGKVVEHEANRKYKAAVIPDQFKDAFQTVDQLATHALKNFL